MMVELILFCSALAGSLVGYGVGRSRAEHNKLSAEQVEKLILKVPPESLPEYSKGPGNGYRQIAARPQCELCRRACVHCHRAAKRKKR